MDRAAPAAHASHDQSLIARLYGGDVDASERARATELMAECQECAALFVDLGSIAEAARAMPVPSRPRDFSLTEADAARLRPRRHAWPSIFGTDLRRSFGSSLAALGLVGVVLAGAASLFGGVASTANPMSLAAEGNAAATAGPLAPGAPGTGSSKLGALDVATAAAAAIPTAAAAASTAAPAGSSGAVQPPVASPAASDDGTRFGGTPAAETPGAVAGPTDQLAPESPEPGLAFNGSGTGTVNGVTAEQAGQGGIDARLVWLIGFGTLFAIGLAILILPRLLKGRGRAR